MTKVQDLEIEKELYPLFNHTIHALAGEALLQLFTDLPGSVEEIEERQDIIKAFLVDWDRFRLFSYSKADLYEVYAFTNNRIENISRINLTINGTKKQQLRSSLTQCLRIFQQLHLFFAPLPVKKFSRIKEFLATFQHSKCETISDISKLMQLFPQEKVRDFWAAFFLFEAWHSIAKTHKKYNFCFPEFTGGEFAITGMYHPLLKQPVKNSIEKNHHVVLLTGPNMSGKSTLLKTMGLCVYLGHLGFGVPASRCQMPFFDTICIAINLKDDLKSGYSHFLSEIKTLKAMVTEAAGNKRCFAVFDELFRGTNLEDALEISKTTIHGLTKFQHSLFFISTHLHQLKELVDLHNIDAHYIECHIKNNQPVFTYQLKTGWSDVKIGQLLFEQEGLNRLLNA